jgi:hypothetical protein
MKKKIKQWIETAKTWILIITICASIPSIIGGLIYLKYTAYRERFPHASPWTFFFQSGK